METELSIQQVARQTGLSIDTLKIEAGTSSCQRQPPLLPIERLTTWYGAGGLEDDKGCPTRNWQFTPVETLEIERTALERSERIWMR